MPFGSWRCWTRLAVVVSTLSAITEAQEIRVLERGANHSRIRQVLVERDAATGTKSVRTNHWVQLEDGLNFWDSTAGTWKESREEIEIVGLGAVALTGAYQALFASNANDPEGALDLRIGDGLRLRSSVLALRYFDAATGGSAILGLVRDVRGELLPPNQIIYRNVFDEVRADLVYTYRKRGVEADVVLREVLPSPEEFGLIPETTRVEVVTEFFDPPKPVKRHRVLAALEDPGLRERVAEPDWVDEELDFGLGRIGEGRAFAWSAREAAERRPGDYPAVGKRWVVTADGRTLLVESVEYAGIYDELLALPGTELRRGALEEKRRLWAGRSVREIRDPAYRKFVGDARDVGAGTGSGDGPLGRWSGSEWAGLRRPMSIASAIEGGIRLSAAGSAVEPGLVLDWNSLTTGASNFTFAATNTYYVTGACTFTGTTTLEGGTVLKFPVAGGPFSGLEIAGPLVCKTGPYRPAVFTADSDNTVGESIVPGSPDPLADHGSRYLRVTHYGVPVVLEHVRFKHANEAVVVQANNVAHVLRHCQFVNCRLPVTSLSATAVRLRNVLIQGGKPTGAVFTGATPFSGEHLTVHQAPSLANGGSLALTNSIVAAVVSVPAYSGVGNWQVANSAGLFDPVGAGNHYLPAASPLRNAGVTGIHPGLREDLSRLTTDAPLVLGGGFGIETHLASRARRDTDLPDIGYHYAPLDFAAGGANVVDTTVRMTDGAALGVYGGSGLVLGSGARFESTGSATAPNRVVYYTQVQEQTASSWASPTGDVGLLEVAASGSGPVPEIRWVFTEAWMPGGPANRRQWIRGTSAGGVVLRSTHSQARGLALTVTGSGMGTSLWLTNNLLEDVELRVSQTTGGGFFPVGLQAFNNLFRGGVVVLSNSRNDSPWGIQDNLFDPLELSFGGLSGTVSHNGYRAGLASVGTANRTGLTMDYVASPLGPFTYPVSASGGNTSTSLVSLLNTGSRGAVLSGLYSFTSRSDSAAETNSVVDIGFHYPAPAFPVGGPLGHWRLDESSGTVAADSSTAGLHGTLVNGPFWTAAQSGNGLNFDGINDQVTIPDAPELRITGPMTVAFWVKKHSEVADWVRYVGKGANHPRNFGVWDWEGSSGRLVFQFRNAAGALASCASLKHVLPGRWYHVACVWDGAVGTVYVDGERDNAAAMAGPVMVSNDPMTLGNAGYSGTLAGVLDEVCLYNRALSNAEVFSLMVGTSPGPVASTEVAKWRLDETSGFVVADTAGSRHPGTSNVGPQWTTGRFGNAIALNGVDDVVTVDDAPALRASGPFSLAFWVRKRGESADWARVVGKGQNYPRNFGVWDWEGSTGRLLFQFRNTAGVLVGVWTTTQLAQGTWYHVACTWDGAVGRIYVDGQVEGTSSMSGPPLTSTDPLTLGHAGHNGFFKGDLDEVGFYGRALSAAEVTALVAGTQPASDLRGYWPLNETTGGVATNVVAGGNPGRSNPGPQWAGGVAGNGLRFDGLSDMVTIPDAPDLRFTGPFTLAFWIQKRSESSDWVRYLGKGQNYPRNFGVWDWEGASGRVLFQFRNGAGTLASVATAAELVLGRWTHVACSWDGATGRIYFDGRLEASGAMAGPPLTSADPVTLGYAGYSGRFAGSLDEIGFYARELSASEIQGLATVRPADGDRDGFADASEDRNGNGVRDSGESSFFDVDSDYDGRSDAEERVEGTDPTNPQSLKPVRLGLWNFDNPADPWRGDNGSVPWERNGVGHVELVTYVYGAEVNSTGAALRYRDVEENGRANINALQGTVRIHYFPYWASLALDCPPGKSGIGPGSFLELLSVGDFSVAIDSRGTNLMLRSPHPNGGWITNAQAKFRACIGDYPPDFPMDIQIAYATNASAIFLNGELLARGSGIQAAPNRGSRAHGFFMGSSPDRTHQAKGVIDAVFTYNVPLRLATNASSMSLAVTQAPPSVSLRWTAVSNCYYRIDRRSPPDTAWQKLASVTPPSYTDTTVVPGREYEYRLAPDAAVPEEFRATTDPAHLTMVSGIRLPPVEAPGHVALIVDRSLTNNPAYASAVAALTRDLSAEGWVVGRFDAPRHDDVIWANNPGRIAQVKNWLAGYRNANPGQPKAVLLFGHLPIPFSGMLSPDGHSFRPLPADTYYGDADGVWTDVENWPPQGSVSAPNVSGDGMYDQEFVPPNAAGRAAVEMAVGRVDFANLPAFATASPSRGEVDLLAQYVEKTRRYRRKELTLPERAVYGGYFASNSVSEAADAISPHLARLATRLASAVVGTNVAGAVKADFMSAGLPAVWGILGGFAGGYDSIHSRGEVRTYQGVAYHQTSDLVLDAAEPPVAFSVIEASWIPEWHAENHIGRALLATKNYGYAWSYASARRVEWQYPSMALGKTIGEAWSKTQNDAWMWPFVSVRIHPTYGTDNPIYTGDPAQGGYVFTPLLGDPTLRQAPPAPPGTVSGQPVGGEIALAWGASPESDAQYHVYRSDFGIGGSWTRLNTVPLTGTSYTDASPPPGAPVYLVRTLVIREVASGSITNLSAGSLWP